MTTRQSITNAEFETGMNGLTRNKSTRIAHLVRRFCLALMLTATAGHSGALELTDSLQLHGYGHLAYLSSEDNPYLEADGDGGTLKNSALALMATQTLNERTKLWGQVFANYYGKQKVRLDWAFLDYRASEQITAHIGQIKLPLGIYNDLRDVSFVQASVVRPLLYQEAAEMVPEVFRGAALIVDQNFSNSGLTWDLYLGQSTSFEANPEYESKSLAGLRLTYNTPVDGLRFMLSSNLNRLKRTDTNESDTAHTYVVSADYVSNKLDLKAEYGLVDTFDRTSKAWYLQAGYRLGANWTPFIRTEYATTDDAQRHDPAYYQYSTVVGLNYLLTENIALRLEQHFNRGYAMPVAAENLEPGDGKTRWNLFSASMVFIF